MMLETRQVLSLTVLLAVVLATAIAIVRSYRRKRYSVVQYSFYLVHLYFTKVQWRASINRPLPIAPDQGAVIVCNHIGPMDPALVQLGTNRIIHWMVAREFCDHPAFRWPLTHLGAIPVNRGGIDTAATKHAIRLLEQGELVGLFPEGRINISSELIQPGRPGVALIALKARVPVVPCFLSGSPYDGTTMGCFFLTTRAHCEVGDPIDLTQYYEQHNERRVQENLTKRFLIELARLAGVDDFVPRMAGRRWKPGSETSDEAELPVPAGAMQSE